MEYHSPFHHRHLPTFVRTWHRFVAWYRGARVWQKFVVNFTGTGLVVYLLYVIFFAAPVGFPQGAYITVSKGETLQGIADDFSSRSVIKYGLLFKFSARLLGDQRRIPAGVYYFPHQQNVVEIAIRLISGDFETTPIKVTIPEGATVVDIAKILEKRMPNFNYRGFVDAAKGEE
ncbi:MAG TPA: endolytic transglycosylase MltG, partial [Candidatus Paceibacterota bacterium]